MLWQQRRARRVSGVTVLTLLAGVSTICADARAETVKVTVTGPVQFNVIQGALANVPDGAPVSMSFNVDSNATKGENIVWKTPIPGLAPVHDLDFSVGYSNGTQISSLNILDAVGTYDLSAIGSYLWTIGRFGNAGAEFDYQQITIAVVPEPATLAMVGLLMLPAFGRRPRRA